MILHQLIDQLPLSIADQSVVELPVVFRVNLSLLPYLLVQTAYDRRQRREAGSASQCVAVPPLILVQHQQVAMLDSPLQLLLQLSTDLVLHLSLSG